MMRIDFVEVANSKSFELIFKGRNAGYDYCFFKYENEFYFEIDLTVYGPYEDYLDALKEICRGYVGCERDASIYRDCVTGFVREINKLENLKKL